MDPYAVLGLQPGATKAEIKKAFRQKAMAHHPDMCVLMPSPWLAGGSLARPAGCVPCFCWHCPAARPCMHSEQLGCRCKRSLHLLQQMAPSSVPPTDPAGTAPHLSMCGPPMIRPSKH